MIIAIFLLCIFNALLFLAILGNFRLIFKLEEEVEKLTMIIVATLVKSDKKIKKEYDLFIKEEEARK